MNLQTLSVIEYCRFFMIFINVTAQINIIAHIIVAVYGGTQVIFV